MYIYTYAFMYVHSRVWLCKNQKPALLFLDYFLYLHYSRFTFYAGKLFELLIKLQAYSSHMCVIHLYIIVHTYRVCMYNALACWCTPPWLNLMSIIWLFLTWTWLYWTNFVATNSLRKLGSALLQCSSTFSKGNYSVACFISQTLAEAVNMYVCIKGFPIRGVILNWMLFR